MKFSEMLLREDFWKILEDTLQDNVDYIGAKGDVDIVDRREDCTL